MIVSDAIPVYLYFGCVKAAEFWLGFQDRIDPLYLSKLGVNKQAVYPKYPISPLICITYIESFNVLIPFLLSLSFSRVPYLPAHWN
jgi:hypothetical protein